MTTDLCILMDGQQYKTYFDLTLKNLEHLVGVFDTSRLEFLRNMNSVKRVVMLVKQGNVYYILDKATGVRYNETFFQ